MHVTIYLPRWRSPKPGRYPFLLYSPRCIVSTSQIFLKYICSSPLTPLLGLELFFFFFINWCWTHHLSYASLRSFIFCHFPIHLPAPILNSYFMTQLSEQHYCVPNKPALLCRLDFLRAVCWAWNTPLLQESVSNFTISSLDAPALHLSWITAHIFPLEVPIHYPPWDDKLHEGSNHDFNQSFSLKHTLSSLKHEIHSVCWINKWHRSYLLTHMERKPFEPSAVLKSIL